MLTIRDVLGSSLEWVKLGWLKDGYELRYGVSRTALAALRMRGRHWGEAVSQGHRYIFRWPGFRKRAVLITDAITGAPVATLTFAGDVGTLHFADNRRQRYTWSTVRARTFTRRWSDGAGRVVVCTCRSFWTSRMTVRFGRIACQVAELELLVLLGEFLAVSQDQQATNVVTKPTYVAD